jgi:hypothetical protein
MGYVFVVGPCYTCGSIMTYNPVRVPSVPIDPATGEPAPPPRGIRQPICRTCCERANPERVANGLDPIVIHDDAYEPEPEENVPYDD